MLCHAQGIVVEQIHSESASSQFEVVLQHAAPVLIADRITAARETIGACARKHHLRASFAPKQYMDQAGSGMHLHISFTQSDVAAQHLSFADFNGIDGISASGRAFMAGILTHLKGLVAVTTPTTNSYRRISPGCWAGSTCCWGVENKEAPLRVCGLGTRRRCELKAVDGTCNPYLAVALTIASGMDGIRNCVSLPPVVSCHAVEQQDPLPSSLGEALDCLELDELLMAALGANMARAFVAIKRSEVEHFKDKSLDEENRVLVTKI